MENTEEAQVFPVGQDQKHENVHVFLDFMSKQVMNYVNVFPPRLTSTQNIQAFGMCFTKTWERTCVSE